MSPRSAEFLAAARDRHAKTHSGTWSLFGQEFVARGGFDRELAASARSAQEVRELGDYEAKPPSRAEAEELVATARRFEAVAEMVDA